MKELPTNSCGWCGAALSECDCGYGRPELLRMDWNKVAEVFGSKGMPSCGMTDATRLGSTGTSKTVYLGEKK